MLLIKYLAALLALSAACSAVSSLENSFMAYTVAQKIYVPCITWQKISKPHNSTSPVRIKAQSNAVNRIDAGRVFACRVIGRGLYALSIVATRQRYGLCAARNQRDETW